MILHDVEERCGHFDREHLRNKKILITGSSGLVGTYLLAYIAFLNRQGYSIEAYAQSLSGPPAHILELLKNTDTRYLQIDLADTSQYQRLPKADVIIHSAGYAQPMLFMSNPVATLKINVTATVELLERLSPNGSFIFMSSAEVYCGSSDETFREDSIGTTTPYHPRAAYIEGKRGGEAACAAFRSQGVRAISLRLGDIYGPGTRMYDKRALNSFIEKALLQKQINLLDAGTAMRTYCYVSDALESVLNVLFCGKEAVYNVGGRSYASIAEVAQLVGKITGTCVVFPETPVEVKGAPPVLRLDLGKIEAEFNKSSYLGLQEGLARTVEWQRELYLGKSSSRV